MLSLKSAGTNKQHSSGAAMTTPDALWEAQRSPAVAADFLGRQRPRQRRQEG